MARSGEGSESAPSLQTWFTWVDGDACKIHLYCYSVDTAKRGIVMFSLPSKRTEQDRSFPREPRSTNRLVHVEDAFTHPHQFVRFDVFAAVRRLLTGENVDQPVDEFVVGPTNVRGGDLVE